MSDKFTTDSSLLQFTRISVELGFTPLVEYCMCITLNKKLACEFSCDAVWPGIVQENGELGDSTCLGQGVNDELLIRLLIKLLCVYACTSLSKRHIDGEYNCDFSQN